MRFPASKVCVVFSHPNHELAIFGILQQLRPQILYLTDGGAEERIQQTKRGLASIDLAGNAEYLNYTERQFYDALIDRDTDFYSSVSKAIGEWLRRCAPDAVLCDAVELYNPVHDMALPLVFSSREPGDDWEVFEIPLIYQSDADGPDAGFEIQRMPAGRTSEAFEFLLTDTELAKKAAARDTIYVELSQQLGTVLSSVSLEHGRREVVARAESPLQQLESRRFLRYESRAETLLSRGEISSPIRYAENYLPVILRLCDPT